MSYLYFTLAGGGKIRDENGNIIHELSNSLDEYPVKFTFVISQDETDTELEGYLKNVDRRHTVRYYRDHGEPIIHKIKLLSVRSSNMLPRCGAYVNRHTYTDRIKVHNIEVVYMHMITDKNMMVDGEDVQGKGTMFVKKSSVSAWELSASFEGHTKLTLRSINLHVSTDGTVVKDLLNPFFELTSYGFNELYEYKRTKIDTESGS